MAIKGKLHTDHVICKHCRREYRAITVLHLRRIHDYDGEHPVEDYKQRFRLRRACCGETRKKMSEAKESFWDQRGQHWTDVKVADEIRRMHRAGRSLRRGQVPVNVYEAGRRLFGTWEAAVTHAGFVYEEASGVRRWDQDTVIAAIKKLAERGSPLSSSYVLEHHPALFSAAIKRFGRSWGAALRAAGFDPGEHQTPRGTWNRQLAED